MYSHVAFANLFKKHALTNTETNLQPRLDITKACIPQAKPCKLSQQVELR